jgi:colanic acid/amylovoran biosynthesis glycosyltransferase
MLGRIRYWTHRAGLGRDQIYHLVVDLMGWWPLVWFGRDRPVQSGRALSIAYVFARHPILSETFIRREIAALKQAGIPIQTVADEPDPASIATDESIAQSDTTYVLPMDSGRRARFIRTCIRRNPLRVLNVFLYVIFSRYGSYKTWKEDIEVIGQAIYLAGILEENRVTHVHAPWANHHAFLAMLAARLMGVTYSVHVRANEFHRVSSNYLLAAKLRNAAFSVTNSHYNEVRLRPLLGARRAETLHVIYNGLDLSQFPLENKRADEPLRLLAIGRLVEMKGFEYLLRACALLRERGVEFQCDVIGAAHESLDANAPLELKKLYRRLDLGGVVQFLGAQPFHAVMRAYLKADIVALPCVIALDGSRDITPNVLLEAMALQRAVVTTPVGAIPEIIEHGVNGIIVPPRDERSLAGALEELARDGALRRKLGRAARKKVEERFDINRNAQEYASLFRRLSL